MTHFTMRTIIEANERAGGYWFSPDTRRFFKCRIAPGVYGGRYFVTSEKGPDGIRKWTVREAKEDGGIGTVGQFQGYRSLGAARTAARNLGKAAR